MMVGANATVETDELVLPTGGPPAQPEAAAMAFAVAAELTRSIGAAARLIDVHGSVHGSTEVVTLHGLVTSYGERAAAIEAAFYTGARGVVNVIEVRPVRDGARNNEALARDVLQMLRDNLHVPEERLRVCVRDGDATLSGSVPAAYQRDAAEAITRHLAGVHHVINTITVAGRPPHK
jgi:osmotically-inducible protein OsmY